MPNASVATAPNPRPVLPEPPWAHALYDALRAAGVTQFAYVPDAGHSVLIDRSLADADVHSIALTTEEEGVALAAGAHLGGARAVLLMQSSGVGNCINMLGMNAECRIPLLMLVTMRGQWGEFNPWQMPMAQATAPVLAAMGIVVQPVEHADEVAETVAAAGQLAFNTCRTVAVLISQRIIGAKAFK